MQKIFLLLLCLPVFGTAYAQTAKKATPPPLAPGSYLVSTILRVLPALTMFVGWNPTDRSHQVGTWRQRGKTKKAAP